LLIKTKTTANKAFAILKIRNKYATIWYLALFFIFVVWSLGLVYFGIQLYKSGQAQFFRDAIVSIPDKLSFEFKSFFNPEERIYIDLPLEAKQRILYTKKRYILNNSMGGLPEKNDWVKGELTFLGKKHKIKLRLKGFGSDNWRHDFQFSYRANIKNSSILGLTKVSLYPPRVRNGSTEWLTMKLAKDEGLISQKVFYRELIINGETMGMYAIQEHPNKTTVERNNRREGPIIFIDKENLLRHMSKSSTGEYKVSEGSFFNLPIKFRHKSKQESLNSIAFELLEGFRLGKLSASEVFDIDQIAKAAAIKAIFKSKEFDYRDMFFYLNPLTNKLEPIIQENHTSLFYEDSKRIPNWLKKVFFLNDTALNTDQITFISQLMKDDKFQEIFIKYIEKYSEPNFLDSLKKKYLSELNEINNKLSLPFNQTFSNFRELYNWSNYIRSFINIPSAAIPIVNKENNLEIHLKLRLTSDIPISLGCIFQRKLIIACPEKKVVTKTSEEEYQAIVFKKIHSKEKIDITKGDLFLEHSLIGIENKLYSNILFFPKFSDINKKKLTFLRGNPNSYSFLSENHSKKQISFLPKKYTISESIIIDNGYSLYVPSGAELIFKNNANIISNGAILLMGTKEKPINISLEDSGFSGIYIYQSQQDSIILHTNFHHLSPIHNTNLSLSGAITFYKSNVVIKNSKFAENKSGDDFLNIFDSTFEIRDSEFSSSRFDALDSDFSNGIISNTKFESIGNDAIDLSGSRVNLENIKITNAGDKGISAGEKSFVSGRNINIENSLIGVASKDLSEVILSNINSINNKLALVAYQKKREFGPGKILLKEPLPNIEISKFVTDKNSSISLESSNIKYNFENTNLLNEIN